MDALVEDKINRGRDNFTRSEEWEIKHYGKEKTRVNG